MVAIYFKKIQFEFETTNANAAVDIITKFAPVHIKQACARNPSILNLGTRGREVVAFIPLPVTHLNRRLGWSRARLANLEEKKVSC